MSVSFKSDEEYGYTLMEKFGVSPAMLESAKKMGLVLAHTTPGIFTLMGPDGQKFGTIPIKTTALTLAKSGGLGPASKQAFQYQFEQAIKVAEKSLLVYGSIDPDDLEVDSGDMKPYKAQKVLDTTLKSAKEALDSALKGEVAKPINPPMFAATGSKGALKDAKEVYQEANGTSATSTYFAIAFFQGLVIGARWMGTTLSLRAEGDSLDDYTEKLQVAGFKVKPKYASVHFDVGHADLGPKTFGAVLSCLGMAGITAVGDVVQIKNKGA